MNAIQSFPGEPLGQGLSVIAATEVAYPHDSTVPALFLEQAQAAPERIALVDDRQMLTYDELAERSAALARRLVAAGVRPGDIIAVGVPRGVDWVTALLATLRAGAAYLPLNAADPARRIGRLLADARPVLLLTADADLAVLADIPRLSLEGEGADSSLPTGFDANLPAYVLYTSGSTGQPKGVLVSHRNIVRLVVNSGFAELSPATRLLQTGAATFDATTFELWGPLLNGGTVVIPAEAVVLDATSLGRVLREQRISTMWLTSPLFSLLSTQDPALFAPLRELIVGGDVVVGERVASVLRACPGLTILNGYGPTENTTFSTIHRIGLDDTEGPVPIGRPIANSTAYVLDEAGRAVNVGIVGELYVGGDGVAIGYLNRPELNAKAFLDDPFRPGQRMYRTGDLAVMRPDGVLNFLGRKDDQIKLRGYRIELGEIEATLRRHPEVGEAVVAVRQRESGERYLAAYATAAGFVDERALREYLVEQLPAYMVPSFVLLLDTLSLNTHGKVDRAVLPDPTERFDLTEYVPPQGPTQERLVRLWQDTLGIRAIGGVDSLFDLGIDSLLATRLAMAINAEFGGTLSATDLLTYSTVEAMAGLLDAAGSPASVPDEAADDGAAPADAYPLSSQQYPLYVEQRKNERSVQYNVPIVVELPADCDLARFDAAWQQLVARHDALRTEFRLAEPPRQHVIERLERPLPIRTAAPEPAALVQPFDLDAGPPWRASLHVDCDRRWFFLDLHHLLVDGASLSQLVWELDCLYRGETLSPIRRQYHEFVQWSTSGLGAALRQSQQSYWAERFATPLARPELPTDRPRPAPRSYASAVLVFDFGCARTQALRQFAAARHCTVFEALALAYSLFLAACTGSDDITFGVPASCRAQAGFDGTVGMFANTICLRIDLQPGESVAGLQARVSRIARDSLQRQGFTFRDLTSLLTPPAVAGRNPLFDTMLALQNRELLRTPFFGRELYLKPLYPGQAMFDLNLQIYEGETDLHAEWEYATELFGVDTLAELRAMWLALVDRTVAAPDIAVAELVPHLATGATPTPAQPSAVVFDF